MQVLLDRSQIEELLEQLADEIGASIPQGEAAALVGIRSRGEILAGRLMRLLGERGFTQLDQGTLDITLYRDDLNQMGHQQPIVRATEIDFDINERLIILVDDVLSTGRSVRAALDALMDLGRPKVIRLAVLIDRGGREFPIGADFVGKKFEVPADKRVQVYLTEVDEREEVVLE